MKFVFENVNPGKLHDELIKAGFNPFPVFVPTESSIDFECDADEEAIRVVAEAHDPSPVPELPSELEVIGQQLVEKDLQILELQGQNQLLGQQVVGLELQNLELQNQNAVLGGQIVGLELSNLELATENQMQGQQLVDMDLRLLNLEGGK